MRVSWEEDTPVVRGIRVMHVILVILVRWEEYTRRDKDGPKQAHRRVATLEWVVVVVDEHDQWARELQKIEASGLVMREGPPDHAHCSGGLR
jgi:hypothetical protein